MFSAAHQTSIMINIINIPKQPAVPKQGLTDC